MTANERQHRAKTATYGAMTAFALMGFTVCSWLSRLPALRDILELTPSQLGTMLMIGSFGSLVALPLTGPLIGRFGPKVIGRSGVITWGIAMTLIVIGVLTTTRSVVQVGMVLMTLGFSQCGSSMNVQGGLIEAYSGHVVLPKLHAMFSVGTVTGAAVSALLVRLGVSVQHHIAGVAVLSLILGFVATHFYVTEAEATEASAGSLKETQPRSAVEEEAADLSAIDRTKLAWREKSTILVGLMVLSAGFMEGAAQDWLALAMIDGYGMEQWMGSLMLGLFLLVMTTVRFRSESLHLRWGVAPLLARMLIIGCIGLALVAFSGMWPLAVLGVVMWAIGSSLVYPSAASALSTDPRMTAARLSVLSTINYGAFLAGPPILGWIAEHLGYEKALAFMIPTVLLGAFLSRWLPDGARGQRPFRRRR